MPQTQPPTTKFYRRGLQWVASLLLLLTAAALPATGIVNLVADSCLSGGVLHVSFNPLINQYQQGAYAIGLSSGCTPNSGAIWYSTNVNSGCPGTGYAVPGAGGSGNPQYLTVSTSIAVTLTSGTFNVIVIAVSNTYIGNCTGDVSACFSGVVVGCAATNTFTPSPTASPTATVSATVTVSPSVSPSFSGSPSFTVSPSASATRTASATATASPTATNTPPSTATYTVTPSSTPTASNSPIYSPTPTFSPTVTSTFTPIPVPMVKSANVSTATLGDTITFCIAWQNNSGGAANIDIWDTLSLATTYLGSNGGGGYTPRIVYWHLGTQGAGAGGTVCYWTLVTGYPWLPGGDLEAWLRDDELPAPLCDAGRVYEVRP